MSTAAEMALVAFAFIWIFKTFIARFLTRKLNQREMKRKSMIGA